MVFLAGFVAQVAMTILVYLKEAISSTDVVNLVTQALTVYSVPMAVMLGGISPPLKRPVRNPRKTAPPSWWP